MAMRRAAVAWAAALVMCCGLLALPLVALGATSAVTIQNSAFNPPTTIVHIGDVVRWTNADAFGHTSTSDTGVWNTGVIAAGGSGSFTFTSAGTFAYHCAIHTFMKGTVTVLAASTPQPTPAPTAPPTPVRTTPPTSPPTAPPTDEPTAQPTTPAPSATATPTATQIKTPTPSAASPGAVAAQDTPAPAAGGGNPAPLLIGVAALAVVALGTIAFFVARRS